MSAASERDLQTETRDVPGVERNHTRRAYPETSCIHQLFEAQVARTPEATASICGETHLTYRQLNERANRLAHYLRAAGVRPETRVGICVERSLDLMVGLLGILKAGGAYVPLDPEYPPQRLAWTLHDSGAELLLTQSRLVEALPAHDARTIRLDADWERIARHDARNPDWPATSDQAAYVIYTSGSTGTPKGVLGLHRGAVNRFEWMWQAYPFAEGEVCCLKTSLGFVDSIWEAFGPLLQGVPTLLVEEAVVKDPQQLVKTLERHQVTRLVLVPSLLRVLLNSHQDLQLRLPHLKMWISSGEALTPELWQRFKKLMPGSLLLNLYGSSEVAADATVFDARGLEAAPRCIPIGFPISNMQAYLLDDGMRHVPIGIPGEIYVGGEGLARGYLNRPDLTAEKFIPNPFATAPGARLYRSGDLGRILPNDAIEYLGRKDQQVKVRGFRIELGEVEHALAQHPAVGEAVVIAREDVPGDARLVAYVVPRAPEPGADEGSPEWGNERIAEWQSVWDETYRQKDSTTDLTFNVTGWNSSYTGQPIPPEEMREWVEQTVEQVLSRSPRRVLEIGCGTGLLLLRLAPHSSVYCGTDFSPTVLRDLRAEVTRPGRELPHVTLRQTTADDFAGFRPHEFDAVILNGIIQYFPSVDYLVRVLESALEVVEPGGFVLVGGVRSLPLLEAFHASVQLHQAPNDCPVGRLRSRVEKQVRNEQELVLDPAFFHALKQHLPKISRVEINLKRGRVRNELTRFRYDAVLYVGEEKSPAGDARVMDWTDLGLTVEALRQRLAGGEEQALRVTRIPNARVLGDVKTWELLDGAGAEGESVPELRRVSEEAAAEGVEPEDIWDLSESLPYDIRLSWSGSGAEGFFEAFFRRKGSGAGRTYGAGSFHTSKPLKELANDPLKGRFMRRIVPQLRRYLQTRLPDYMVPSRFVFLDALPLTPTGKIDQRVLSEVELPALVTYEGANSGSLVDTLRSIWERVLGHDEFELDDDFFDVGGDSLLATWVVAEMSHALGREFDLSILQQDSTLSGIARTLAELELQPAGAKRPSEAIQSTEPAHTMGRPLTPFERMLVVMSDGASLNCCVISRVRGPLTEARLTEALSAVQRRHPLLRVRIVDGRSFTEEDVPAIPLRVLDCDEHSTNAVVERELSVPLPVERGPLIRVSWLRHKSNLGTLVFTFHHVIGDGVSSGVLVRDLIGAAAGTLNLPFRSLDTVTPLEEILPAGLQGWRGDWSFLRLFARSVWRAATQGRPLQLRVARWIPPAERTIHVLGRSLNGAFIGALAKKAHAEHTGIHGALAAAICMAVAGDGRAAKRTPVLFGSAVNVRDQLEPAMGEEFGFYVGFSQFRELIDPCGDLWEVARRVQAELVRDRQQLRPLIMLRMVRLGMKLSGMGRRSPAEVANRFAQAAPVTGGLTFVQSLPQARLSIEPKVGPLEIESLHFAGAPSAMSDMTFAASLFAGRLQLNAMWPEPAIDELQANWIVDDVIARLEAAVSWTQWGGRSTDQFQEQSTAAEAFWRKELRGFSSPTPLAVGRAPGELLTHEFDCGEIAISQSPATQLQALAEAHGLNLRTFALGALALLLSRYSDDENVVFGLRVEGRSPGLPGPGIIVGPFANILPLRVRVSPDTQVIDWLKQIQSRYEEVCRHQYGPLEEIEKWSAAPEDLPVFEIEIAFDNDLTLKLTYDRARFDEETVARMLNHLRTILEGIAAQPEQTVHTVPLLDQQEYRQLVTDLNDTDIGYPQDQCIHWMFESQAEQIPEVDAVVVGNDRLSYAALNERANQLAHHLRSLGVGPEVRVAICVERSFDMLVGIIGILKAGGAYVPLDPSYPAERLAFMLEDAQASVLLTQERLEDQLPAHLGTVVFLDSDWSQISQCDTTNPDSGVGGDNLAYVIYTSGSTGKPKGVMVTHRGICNTSEAMVRVYDFPPGTRMLQFGSLSFDMAVFDIIPAIISGGTLVLAPQNPPTGQDLLQLVREQDIQVLTLPPSVLATLPFEDLPHLQFVRVAGEPISSDLAALWSPGRRFYNAYGPAEGSVWVSGAFLDGTGISAIGAPISNTKLYVLTSQQSPVPVGVPGELCIGGISVSRGYLNRPETTAERFIPDPFSEQPGMRLYRTGDLARYWPNGDLEFLGRKDHQVKLHGVRIELGEIESALRKHPAVREAATLLREDVPGNQRLVGYILPKDGEKPAPQDLRNFLAEKLPATMVPTAFVILDKLPLTPNGKLDLRALPPPPSQSFDNEAGYVAPRNEIEEKLAGIWAEVLGKDLIGVHDNFFDLGGYSLLATQVASRICSAFNVELSLPHLLEATTVAQVSELITTIKSSSEVDRVRESFS